ncbi:MAG: phosphatase PAP2 family protein [Planctomycetota bacterium]
MRWYVFFFLVALFLTALSLPFDLAILRSAKQLNLRGDVAKFFDYCELFGHGLGVALIIATATVLDHRSYRSAAYLIICAYGAGLVADATKLIVARTRPYYLQDLGGSVADTVVEWFPVWSFEFIKQANTSFPSGHTATAFGLALGLGALYPRGRFLFLGFAMLTGVQRVSTFAHYPSDVAAGAAIACLMMMIHHHPFLTSCTSPPLSHDIRDSAGKSLAANGV